MLKKIEISSIVIFFIFVFYCAFAIGTSWDLNMEIDRGNQRLKYIFFLSDFESYVKASRGLGDEFYPAFYTTLVSFIAKNFPKKYEFESWQIINSIFAILTIFGISKISSILFNKQVGKIVFVICFFNPIFFGHMSMNVKDIPIAFANVWATYVFLRYLINQNLSHKCTRYIIFAGLAIGVGTGMRLPFVTTLIPIFLFSIIDIFYFKKIVNNKFSFKKFIIHIFIVLLIAYIITISCWPHVHKNIFIEPFKIAMDINKIQYFGLPWVMFNGDIFDTNYVPKLYLIVNFFYKSPEYIILSYIIFIYLLIFKKKFLISKFEFFYGKLFLIVFILLFPTLVLFFLPYRIYDGLRLFLYLIPYFSIIPGIAIYYLISNLKLKSSKTVSAIMAIAFFYYLFIFATLTPYHYIYLNYFVGNYSNSHTKFENDYWAISIKELTKKISKETDLISKNKKIKIAFCALPNGLVEKELNNVNLKYEVKDLSSNDFNYIIMTNRIVGEKSNNTKELVKSCYVKYKGKDIVSVKRNGLILSTIRKIN